ncbi:hypothetical protein H2200_010065 [Cladophialophora chaetospira]|uniref:Peptidase S26 domain-containing protein n=1 Tax=Cladophialophora chaetospira TaxID=386627 RepID=A0AA39CEJ9_9EURO|nr:hypothetical protein H2200_010065 [Cladophialophora chaetospira]
MPPASRGFIPSSFNHAFRTYNLRSRLLQRRLVARAPPKPKLPPASVIETAVAQSIKNAQALKARKALEARNAQEKKPPGRWQSFLLRIPLPPSIQRFFQQLSPPSWVRRWVWRLFIFGPPIAVLVTSSPLTICRVVGPSMAPFFNANSLPDEPAPYRDWILVRKVHSLEVLPWSKFFRTLKRKGLERGQIVVIYAPHDPKLLAVKRVIGLPGDRVQPLAGYPGGDENPVVIPYNHIWVEGDANSRDKSIDSNDFGPISQNMVYGYAFAAYTPGYNWPVWLNWEEDEYPAKESGRVERDVVGSARLDPDEEARQIENPFKTGAAALELAMIRQNRGRVLKNMRAKSMLDKYRAMYALATKEFEKGENADTRDVAEGLIDELEVAFETVGLNKDGSRVAAGVNGLGKRNGIGEAARVTGV